VVAEMTNKEDNKDNNQKAETQVVAEMTNKEDNKDNHQRAETQVLVIKR
jgi:hypothetical protein